jgi:hypothetical protein
LVDGEATTFTTSAHGKVKRGLSPAITASASSLVTTRSRHVGDSRYAMPRPTPHTLTATTAGVHSAIVATAPPMPIEPKAMPR